MIDFLFFQHPHEFTKLIIFACICIKSVTVVEGSGSGGKCLSQNMPESVRLDKRTAERVTNHRHLPCHPLTRKKQDGRKEALGFLGIMFICNEISMAVIRKQDTITRSVPMRQSPGPCHSGKGPYKLPWMSMCGMEWGWGWWKMGYKQGCHANLAEKKENLATVTKNLCRGQDAGKIRLFRNYFRNEHAIDCYF